MYNFVPWTYRLEEGRGGRGGREGKPEGSAQGRVQDFLSGEGWLVPESMEYGPKLLNWNRIGKVWDLHIKC